MILKEHPRVIHLLGRFKILKKQVGAMNDNCNSKNEMLAKRLKSLTTKVSALEKNFENYRDLYFSEAIDRALWELECDAAFMLERLNVEYNKRKPSKGEYCVRKPMP